MFLSLPRVLFNNTVLDPSHGIPLICSIFSFLVTFIWQRGYFFCKPTWKLRKYFLSENRAWKPEKTYFATFLPQDCKEYVISIPFRGILTSSSNPFLPSHGCLVWIYGSNRSVTKLSSTGTLPKLLKSCWSYFNYLNDLIVLLFQDLTNAGVGLEYSCPLPHNFPANSYSYFIFTYCSLKKVFAHDQGWIITFPGFCSPLVVFCMFFLLFEMHMP